MRETMKYYVTGFMYSETREDVALITKNSQNGKKVC